MAYNTDGSRTGLYMDLSLQNGDNAGTALSFIRSTTEPSISLIKDITTTPSGIAMNPTGLAYDNGTTITSTTWDNLSTRIAQLSAIAPNGLNATLLAVNNTISVQNADTSPTRVINTSAEDGTGGTHFGVAWVGNTLPFVMETLDSTPLQVKDTSFVLLDSVAPLTTTMTATDLTSGATTRTWADILASSGSTNTLDQVLSNGNTATGTYANITLNDTGTGGGSNPMISLNQNDTATGSATIRMYKNISTNGSAIGEMTFNANTTTATNQEYARIATTIRNNTSGNLDGSISLNARVNNVNTEFIRVNGVDSQTEFLQPVDMNGNAINTGTGDISLDASASTGNGNINISAKTTTGIINLNSNVVMDNSELLQIRDTANQNIIEIEENEVSMTSTDGTDFVELAYFNNLSTGNNIIRQRYTEASVGSGDITTTSTCIPTNQSLDLNDTRTANNKYIKLDNSGTTENRVSMRKNEGGGIYEESGIYNNPTEQALYLSYTNNANSKSINITNTSAGNGSISYTDTTGAGDFTITSSKRLELTADPAQAIELNANSIELNGASLISPSAGGNSGNYLQLIINGTTYYVPLHNP